MTTILPSIFLPRLRGKNLNLDEVDVRNALSRLRTVVNTGLDDTECAFVRAWLNRLFTIYEDDGILDEAGELLTITTQSLQPDNNRSGQPYRFYSPAGYQDIVIEDSYMQDVHATGFTTWSSSIHLARRMLADPSQFFVPHGGPPGKRIRLLEIGSGTGLAGIAACKALALTQTHARVVLSDMDPPTLQNLHKNLLNNEISLAQKDAVYAEIVRLDWSNHRSTILEPFDIVIGADVVYEPEHASLIYGVVERLLARTPSSIFHLVLVTRPTHTSDIRALDEQFARSSHQDVARLVISTCETIQATEVDTYPYGHRYYQIRWHGLPRT